MQMPYIAETAYPDSYAEISLIKQGLHPPRHDSNIYHVLGNRQRIESDYHRREVYPKRTSSGSFLYGVTLRRRIKTLQLISVSPAEGTRLRHRPC
jgi:hypothetical protein